MIRALALTMAMIVAALPLRAEVDVQVVETPGGLTAWLVEEHSIPFVALEITFRGGTSLDDPAKRGATYLMTALLEEGAGDLDARGFAAARDDLAMGLGFDSSADEISVSARFLTETADDAAALIRTALIEPRFDEDAVERVRRQVISGIRSDAEDPQEIASRTLAARLYGDHPYATAGEGTEDSVAALTRDDLLAAHAGAIARDRVFISAVGDIDAPTLAVLLDRILDGIPATGAPQPGVADPDFDDAVTVVDYPTPQAVISFAQPGLPQDHPDFFPAYVLGQVLGAGGFESRLMEEIREKRGLTYGVAAYLISRDHADLVMGGMSTANATVAESLELIGQEWERIRDEGITPEELEAAKTYLTGAYPLRFDGNGRIAGILTGMQMMGLGPDYIATRNDKVEAVTLADTDRVAAELFDPEKLSVVVVGQPEDALN